MGGDQPIDDDTVSRKSAKGANLIQPHETAIALDIGGEDRGELPFDGVRFQGLGTSRIEYNLNGRESEGL
jgi:hypothetical protein